MKQLNYINTRSTKIDYDYIVFIPENYNKADSIGWPLIMFLHGAFERGDDLEVLKQNGLPKIAAKKEFPFIIIAPQCSVQNHWKPEFIESIIDEVIKKFNIDTNRIYLTGLSMGGFGTWQAASQNPNKYAAIIPICGGGNTVMAFKLVNIPIWAFHGKKDPVIPLHKSEEMVHAVNEKGGNAKLTIYPNAEHDSWTETYNNDEIYNWLLSHSLEDKNIN